RNRLTWSGIALGLLTFVVSLAVAAGVTWILWTIIGRLFPGYTMIFQGDVYNSRFYFGAFASLVVALFALLYGWAGEKITVANLTAGSLAGWLTLAVSASLFLAGGSYLFIWPLLFALVGLNFQVVARRPGESWLKEVAVHFACAVPGIILLVPACLLIFAALGMDQIAVVSITIVLLLSLLIPLFLVVTKANRWLLPAGAALVSLVLFVAGTITHGFDADHPEPDSIFYAMNADLGKAVWASMDRTPGQCTSLFIREHPERGGLPDYVPSSYSGFLNSPAPVASIAPPNVILIGESTAENVRTLNLRISSGRGAPVLMIVVPPDVQVFHSSVDGKPLPTQSGKGLSLRYYGAPREGIAITLEINSAGPLTVRTTDMSYSLPDAIGDPVKPCPSATMPAILPYSDSTFVTKTFTF